MGVSVTSYPAVMVELLIVGVVELLTVGMVELLNL